MPKTKISEYSATNSANTDIEGINIDEGCAPSGINNAIRELMVHLKEFQTGASGDAFTFAGGTLMSGTNTISGAAIISGNINSSGTNTFSGSNVMSFSGGSSASPSIYFASDTNTGIFSPAADTIAFTEGGAESMRIDSSGNVGIGTTSPANRLSIGSGSFASATAQTTGMYTNGTSGLVLLSDAYSFNSRTGSGYAIIDSSGNVGIGTTTPTSTYSSRLVSVAASGAAALSLDSPSGTNSSINFYYNGAAKWTTQVLTTGEYRWYDFTASAERMRIDTSGNVGIGTSSPATKLYVAGAIRAESVVDSIYTGTTTGSQLGAFRMYGTGSGVTGETQIRTVLDTGSITAASLQFYTGVSERARITSGGIFLVGKTATGIGTVGSELGQGGDALFTASGSALIYCNRLASDGNLVEFRQDGVTEGTISVSGTTVSYNGGHLSRWAQMPGTKDDTIVKGTVMSNLDEMNVYTDAEGNPVDNEQLNKVKVSDVEGDVNVAGVFVNWTYDDAHQVDEINMAMTGDMIIRIAQGVVVQKGDLLMSAGDGTAKPQGDDIVRSKTVAKVTSNHVTCTYADGSYCVPCVLMAC